MTTPKVPRDHSRHALAPLYDWLDKYVTNATDVDSGGGATLPTGSGDGQGIAWDNTAKSWGLHGITQTMSYQISEVDLLAHVTQHLILHPGIGFTNSVQAMMIAVQKTVTTGGIIKMQKGGVDVAGCTATVANGATAGTHYLTFTSDASGNYGFGDDITLVLSGFSGAGMLNAFIWTAAGPP